MSNYPRQVLDLSSAAATTVPSPAERPAGAYKAAVDRFIQNDHRSRSTLDVESEETSPPEVEEWKTQALQQLLASAKTLTAREDLLHTFRWDLTRTQRFKIVTLHKKHLYSLLHISICLAHILEVFGLYVK